MKSTFREVTPSSGDPSTTEVVRRQAAYYRSSEQSVDELNNEIEYDMDEQVQITRRLQ